MSYMNSNSNDLFMEMDAPCEEGLFDDFCAPVEAYT